MSEVTEAPKAAAKGAGSLLKKIPVWGWALIGAGFLLFFIYQRHNQQAAAASAASNDQNASADPSQVDNTGDASTYGADTNGADQAYLSGYDSAAYGSNLPTDVFGGASTGSGGGTVANGTPTSPNSTLNVVVNTGGGLPPKDTAPHTQPGVTPPKGGNAPKPSVKGGIIVGPTSHRPAARKGYTIKGRGKGYWEYVPTRKPTKPAKPPKGGGEGERN